MSKVNPRTISEYYALPGEYNVELIDGVFYEVPVKGTLHQDIASYFHILIGGYVREQGIDCKVYEGPVGIRILQDNYNIFKPDLFAVFNKVIIGRAGICGAPEFIIEIITDKASRRAMNAKFERYCDAKVKELWIVDVQGRKLESYIYSGDKYLKKVYNLEGEILIGTFKEKLSINLNEINDIIEEYELMKD
ncbi:Uma2 family endonuclease [Butyrivibrio sp. AE3004]|uniref:Uma2 family endonuclease n=1 Tax=Butyrivibrio sp. AE3004 TaxID=1506994 RepID=UPI000494216E|nr:Uma2 family endonuclease [Butyrivibrio sp. AE3004]